VQELYELGEIDRAAWLACVPSDHKSRNALTYILTQLRRAGQHARCLDVFNLARQRLRPDEVMYTQYICSLISLNGDLESVRQAFASLAADGFRPDAALLEHVIQAALTTAHALPIVLFARDYAVDAGIHLGPGTLRNLWVLHAASIPAAPVEDAAVRAGADRLRHLDTSPSSASASLISAASVQPDSEDPGTAFKQHLHVVQALWTATDRRSPALLAIRAAMRANFVGTAVRIFCEADQDFPEEDRRVAWFELMPTALSHRDPAPWLQLLNYSATHDIPGVGKDWHRHAFEMFESASKPVCHRAYDVYARVPPVNTKGTMNAIMKALRHLLRSNDAKASPEVLKVCRELYMELFSLPKTVEIRLGASRIKELVDAHTRAFSYSALVATHKDQVPEVLQLLEMMEAQYGSSPMNGLPKLRAVLMRHTSESDHLGQSDALVS